MDKSLVLQLKDDIRTSILKTLEGMSKTNVSRLSWFGEESNTEDIFETMVTEMVDLFNTPHPTTDVSLERLLLSNISVDLEALFNFEYMSRVMPIHCLPGYFEIEHVDTLEGCFQTTEGRDYSGFIKKMDRLYRNYLNKVKTTKWWEESSWSDYNLTLVDATVSNTIKMSLVLH